MKMPHEIQRDEATHPGGDDYVIACEMALDMCGRSNPGHVVKCFAQWVATLREHYVQIGREVERSGKVV